jgi:hypothetical protein
LRGSQGLAATSTTADMLGFLYENITTKKRKAEHSFLTFLTLNAFGNS